MATEIQIWETGECECIAAPMGEHRLEGYVEGGIYKYELCQKVENGIRPPSYARLYHSPDYYETCGLGTFRRHFRVITQ